jgi:hypothetical protein
MEQVAQLGPVSPSSLVCITLNKLEEEEEEDDSFSGASDIHISTHYRKLPYPPPLPLLIPKINWDERGGKTMIVVMVMIATYCHRRRRFPRPVVVEIDSGGEFLYNISLRMHLYLSKYTRMHMCVM